MNITEKCKLLYYIIDCVKSHQLADARRNINLLTTTFKSSSINISVTEYRLYGDDCDLLVKYLGKEHRISARNNNCRLAIDEETDNNFWDTFDEVTIKMLLG